MRQPKLIREECKKTAVVIVCEEDNDVTLTTDQHVVIGNEQNVVDPLRNLDEKKEKRSCINCVLHKVHVRLL